MRFLKLFLLFLFLFQGFSFPVFADNNNNLTHPDCEIFQSRFEKNDCYISKAVGDFIPSYCENLSVMHLGDTKDSLYCYVDSKPTVGIVALESFSFLWVLIIFIYPIFALIRRKEDNLGKKFIYSSLILALLLIVVLQIEDFRFDRLSFIGFFHNPYNFSLEILYALKFPSIINVYLFAYLLPALLVIFLPIANFINLILRKKTNSSLTLTLTLTILNYIFIVIVVAFAFLVMNALDAIF